MLKRAEFLSEVIFLISIGVIVLGWIAHLPLAVGIIGFALLAVSLFAIKVIRFFE